MKHVLWDRWCIFSSCSRVGRLSPDQATRGRNVTFVIAMLPCSSSASTPVASSTYSSTINPRLAAIARNISIWQLDRVATNASSGSTFSAMENGRGTTSGDDDAATTAPPSNSHAWPRLYLLSVNFSPSRCHRIVATWVDTQASFFGINNHKTIATRNNAGMSP